MAEGEQSGGPRPLTIRLGTEMFSDVRDYLMIVRLADGTVSTRVSDRAWAYGATYGPAASGGPVSVDVKPSGDIGRGNL